MTDSRGDRIEALFHRLLEQPEPLRAEFIRQQCGDDAELRRQLESLLAGHRAADSGFLEGTTVEPSRAVPRRIGRYSIVRRIGEGGMGIVYEARQENPRRPVALKVIRPERASADLLRRFEREAAVLARLQHPGIAQVYEAGTATIEWGDDARDADRSSRPYFAMELIQGRSLIEHAEHDDLDLEARLLLHARVCDAVQHAHQNAVLHRDLKPANILVEESGDAAGGPRPRVLDFGLARMLDADTQRSVQTDHGEVLGTLQYMSPEQIDGPTEALDTRCDLYALGVILHELVTGELPYDLRGRSLTDVARIITHSDPSTATRRGVAVDGDLGVVLAKTLETDRRRRYATAAELAAELRRVVANQPILARPPTASYLLRKFARRHRALVTTICVALIALVVGLFAALVQKERADRARDAETGQRLAAEAQARRARRATLFLQEMLSQADPEYSRGREVTVREALDTAAARIDADSSEEPEVEAAVRFAIGSSYASLARFEEAERMFQRALEIRTGQLDRPSRETADLLNSIAMLRIKQGRSNEALELIEQALEVMVRAEPDNVLAALTIQENRGNALQALGRAAEVEPILRAILARRIEIQGEDHPEIAATRQNLAVVLNGLGHADEAEDLMTLAYRWFLDHHGRRHPKTLASLLNLARMYVDSGRYQEAEVLSRQAIESAEELFEPDHADLASALGLLGTILVKQRRDEQAVPILREALRITRVRFDKDSVQQAASMKDLAQALLQTGQEEEAEALLHRALAIQRARPVQAGIDVVWTMQALASSLLERGRIEDAESLLREAVALSRELEGSGHRTSLFLLSHLGNALHKKGDVDQAAVVSAEVLEGQRRVLGEDHPEVAVATFNLAAAEKQRGDLESAEKFAREAVRLLDDSFGADHSSVTRALVQLAELKQARSDLDGAVELFREVLERQHRRYGSEHATTRQAELTLIRVLIQSGLSEEEARRVARIADS